METPEKTPLDNVVNIADLRKMDEEAFNKWYMDKVHRQTAHLFGEPERMNNEDALLVAQRRWGVKNARITWNPARMMGPWMASSLGLSARRRAEREGSGSAKMKAKRKNRKKLPHMRARG